MIGDLVESVRASRRLTPRQACEAADSYATYFRDVGTLTIEATCRARSRLGAGGCHAEPDQPTGETELLYLFARAASGTEPRWEWRMSQPRPVVHAGSVKRPREVYSRSLSGQ